MFLPKSGDKLKEIKQAVRENQQAMKAFKKVLSKSLKHGLTKEEQREQCNEKDLGKTKTASQGYLGVS